MIRAVIWLNLLCLLCSSRAAAEIPSPREIFGFRPGDDLKLADYQQMREYYRLLDASSDRIRVFNIGSSAEGQQMILSVISSASNLKKMEEYRLASEKLARARIDQKEARKLAETGKVIVWIDGGLHSTEVAHAQQSPILAYRVLTDESPEMQFIRENVILLQVPVMNPDGLNMVTNWYEKNLGTQFETSPLPWLYHKYVGHDNNRDWYMMTQVETRNVSRILYEEWFPQIVYNHHQSPPFPARIFVPPFAPPMNPNIPPLVLRGINLVGSAISSRFEMEEKSGVISRINYTTWWNGGMRTVPYFHNMIGILTETALYRYATPHYYNKEDLPDRFSNGLPTLEPSADYPNPWLGGLWRLSDAVEYMLTASVAVLDVAARHRSQWLYNMYLMGQKAIERGRMETPRAYLVPPNQHDPSSAVEMLRALRRGGVEISMAKSEFQSDGKTYPEGTFIIDAAQAFRPYIVDLMEPQKYPDRRLYKGGPPIKPYDITGWTLPLQMGVNVIPVDQQQVSVGPPLKQIRLAEAPSLEDDAEAFLIDRRWNLSYRLINELLRKGVSVRVSSKEISLKEGDCPPGCFVVDGKDRYHLQELSRRFRLPVLTLSENLGKELSNLQLPRVGLYKSAVANVDEGWTRWILEKYLFEYQSVDNQDIRDGELRRRFDVIILPSQSVEQMRSGHPPGSVPLEYSGGMGIEGFSQLKVFTEEGGILVTLDEASELPVSHFDIPVRNVLEGVDSNEFYCPGSLVRLEVDPTDPVGYGMDKTGAAFFVGSRAFDLGYFGERPKRTTPQPANGSSIIHSVAHYGRGDILLSGWILGPEKIQGKASVVRLGLGQGQVVMLGFRSQFRAQPHGTFKLLFNAIYLGGRGQR